MQFNFRSCIDLMHISPPVTAEGFDGSHHPRFTQCQSTSIGHRNFILYFQNIYLPIQKLYFWKLSLLE